MGPKSNNECPDQRKEEGRLETDTQEGHMEGKQTSVMHLQAKECLSRQRLDDTGRSLP